MPRLLPANVARAAATVLRSPTPTCGTALRPFIVSATNAIEILQLEQRLNPPAGDLIAEYRQPHSVNRLTRMAAASCGPMLCSRSARLAVAPPSPLATPA